MTSLTYRVGDATQPEGRGLKIIAHGCNDIGAWGAGFVVALSNRWPVTRNAYLQTHKDGLATLGTVEFLDVESNIVVANMVTQRGLRSESNPSPFDYDAFERCLRWVKNFARLNAASVHMPRVGAGLAGGDWVRIEAIIDRVLCQNGIETFIYDLPGTR